MDTRRIGWRTAALMIGLVAGVWLSRRSLPPPPAPPEQPVAIVPAPEEPPPDDAASFFTEPDPDIAGMRIVHILAWDLVDGHKTSVEAQVVVCDELADEVLAIFREIHDDPERFPIHDLVGYNYRTIAGGRGLSNHAYGRAIDINRVENPMIQNGEKIVHPDEPPYVPGEWSPGVNPYSITPDGSVVRAFKSRGWRWGGDWTSCKDYQHFDKPRPR
jgi:hypothetical protein